MFACIIACIIAWAVVIGFKLYEYFKNKNQNPQTFPKEKNPYLDSSPERKTPSKSLKH